MIERKAADEAAFIDLHRADLTLNSIGDAVLSTDTQGTVTYLNRVAECMNRLAVLFLDVDLLTDVNDSRGHVAGDIVLQSVAQRLLACVRHSDTVRRHGGDEFVVLLPQITHAPDAAASAQKVIRAPVAPHDVARHRIHLTVTVGVSIYPDDGSDAETLVRCADTEMYRAKDSGRNAYRYFERHMDEPAVGSA